ncbi:AIPR family protein [Vagococcus acidifermentans]|uniref:Abortive phage infection protein C-terminal domain-containing protein n=1 Tax=Vagococcus acidifermentans TaxID=564710 RepID=A0A430AWY3_9ENTE|nr:AIPR family protein [Vagococcus acidifermentans]RSU12581.1 hypothetical protein CBF27_06300 [Vagococcus acidifermentans]
MSINNKYTMKVRKEITQLLTDNGNESYDYPLLVNQVDELLNNEIKDKIGLTNTSLGISYESGEMLEDQNIFIFINYKKIKTAFTDNGGLTDQIEKCIGDKYIDLSELKVKKNDKPNVFIYMLVDSIKDRRIVSSKEEEKKIKKLFQKVFKEKGLGKMLLRQINYRALFIPQPLKEKYNSVKLERRIKSLEVEKKLELNNNEKDIYLKGMAFTADLKDIITFYDDLGEALFEKNLRYQIKEQLGVDSSIRKTIKEDPESFWFLNNGITMYVENFDQLDLSRYDRLRILLGEDKVVSVVNGAQTISSSLFEEITGKVKVIFRIFTFYEVHDNEKKAVNLKNKDNDIKSVMSKEIEKITISLNRQKPITTEDLRYRMPFVEAVNQLSFEEKTDSEISFEFIRRGETQSNYLQRYSLIAFARIVEAYKNEHPGSARSKGINSLLKIKTKTENNNDIDQFAEKTIFIGQDFLEKDDIDGFGEKFKEEYKDVNQAFRVKAYLDEIFKDFEKSKNSSLKDSFQKFEESNYSMEFKTISTNGVYFILTYIMNYKKDLDYLKG